MHNLSRVFQQDFNYPKRRERRFQNLSSLRRNEREAHLQKKLRSVTPVTESITCFHGFGSDEEKTRLKSCKAMREALWCENANINEIIQPNHIATIIEWMTCGFNSNLGMQIFIQCAWIIANIAAGKHDCACALVEAGVVETFVKLYQKKNSIKDFG